MPDPRSRPPPRPTVLMIGSEAVPFAKTGGLADVLGALPLALQRLGWDVTLVLPRYRGIRAGVFVERIPITIGDRVSKVGFFEAPLGDTDAGREGHPRRRARVVRPRRPLYSAANIDYPDNPRRFARSGARRTGMVGL